MKTAIKEIEAYNQRCYDYAMELESWFEELGPLIREAREKKGLSLRDMAKKLKISPAFLSDIELGRRNISDKVLQGLKNL